MRILTAARTGAVATFSVLAATTAFAVLAPATAAPVSPAVISNTASAPAMAQVADGKVQLAQYRGRNWRGGWQGRRHGNWRGRGWRNRGWAGRRGYRGRRYGYGPSVAGAIASAIIGGSIVASQRNYRDAWQRCDDRYNSFRWSDGTFQPYGDEPRKLCPYLRN